MITYFYWALVAALVVSVLLLLGNRLKEWKIAAIK